MPPGKSSLYSCSEIKKTGLGMAPATGIKPRIPIVSKGFLQKSRLLFRVLLSGAGPGQRGKTPAGSRAKRFLILMQTPLDSGSPPMVYCACRCSFIPPLFPFAMVWGGLLFARCALSLAAGEPSRGRDSPAAIWWARCLSIYPALRWRIPSPGSYLPNIPAKAIPLPLPGNADGDGRKPLCVHVPDDCGG